MVQLLFQGSAHSDFVAFSGNAYVSKDKQKIKELWEPILKTWFTDGVDDERITIIKVKPVQGYYWDTKHGKLVAFAKQIAGAAAGKTLDDSIEGKLADGRKRLLRRSDNFLMGPVTLYSSRFKRNSNC